MKFRCERDTLAEAVATAQRTVASRTGALPVLQDLRITASGDGLELVGSDLEITNRVQVPAEVEETGVAVVPKMLGDIVRKLEPGTVTSSGAGAPGSVCSTSPAGCPSCPSSAVSRGKMNSTVQSAISRDLRCMPGTQARW